jgi:hypothetical protein
MYCHLHEYVLFVTRDIVYSVLEINEETDFNDHNIGRTPYYINVITTI